MLAAHVARQFTAIKHPVIDFLFSYYAFRPGQLLRWSPGIGVRLLGATPENFWAHEAFMHADNGLIVDPSALPAQRRESVSYILHLLQTTAQRAPHFGCFGLHEWAMVYRSIERRHEQTPLRLSHDALAAFVESQALCCTHYDAFRFFTPAAAPRNRVQLVRSEQSEHEQPGCIHATMDLYKWAFKLWPWIDSDLIADCFFLARAARDIDMRASPYDLQQFNLAPICIEAEAGRAEYQAAQRDLAARAAPLRARVIAACQAIRSANIAAPNKPAESPSAC